MRQHSIVNTIMRAQILELIQNKPKHYVKLIKSNTQMLAWVQENSLIKDTLPAMIYSAINQVSNLCPFGKTKKFNRFSTGFIGCGPASTCECTSKTISKNVKESKSQYSNDKNDLINQKRQTTMLSKYGVAYNSQRQDIKHIWTAHKIPQSAVDALENVEWLNNQYNEEKRTLVDIADELGVYYGTVAEYCKRHGFEIRQRSQYSLIEKHISEFLTQHGIVHEMGNWSILGNREIDIFIPAHKMAIEVNGLYWHSWNPSGNKIEQKNRHLEKTQRLLEQGIELFHVTDHEWIQKTEIVKSVLLSKLGLNEKISARKCQIRQVSVSTQRDFLTAYHLQGYVNASQALGLYFEETLVQLITLGIPRFDRKYDIELIRFCSKSGVTVVGGLSKLIAHVKKQLPACKLITYCDASKSQAKGYISSGFTFIRQTTPGYFWTDGNIPISRHRCQKKKLGTWLIGFDPTKSESENMFAAGYRRFWDCGNLVLELDNSNK
jgi:G:T-mismatch repair DNA endonuclease (very short patch repair protein)